jgi:glycosyltransferase involved in cell wall biosynthesis
LTKAIESLLPQLGEGVDLLVIDNGSTDSTPEVLAGFAKENSRITVFREEKPGIANARNAALRNAKGEWVLFFDDDEMAPAGWIQKYQVFLGSHPNPPLGAVGGGCEPEFDVSPPAWFNIERARLYMGESDLKLTGKRSPGAGNCAYHRETALKLGGFCAELARAEDTDLNMRLQKAGFEVWWLARAPILHLTPVSRVTIGSMTRTAFIEGRSYARLRSRHCSGIAVREFYRIGRIVLAPFHCLFLLFWALITLPLRSGQVAVRSLQRAARAAGMGWQLLIDVGR